MALQSSGPISLSQIQGEFGGSAPTSLSEYYGAAGGVPSSGLISCSDFYGTSDLKPDWATSIPDPTDSSTLNYIVFSGTLGSPNADVYYFNNDTVGGFISYAGVNSYGENVVPWAGGSGNIDSQYNAIMITTRVNPNDWAYFKWTVYSNSGASNWYVSNPVWSPFTPNGYDTAYYLTDGNVYATDGILSGITDIAGTGGGSMGYVAAVKFDSSESGLSLINQAMDYYFQQRLYHTITL